MLKFDDELDLFRIWNKEKRQNFIITCWLDIPEESLHHFALKFTSKILWRKLPVYITFFHRGTVIKIIINIIFFFFLRFPFKVLFYVPACWQSLSSKLASAKVGDQERVKMVPKAVLRG